MNILLTATRVEGAPASVVLDAAAGPWKERADVDSVPVSDGEGDLCEVLAQLSGGELGAIEAARPSRSVPSYRTGAGFSTCRSRGARTPGASA